MATPPLGSMMVLLLSSLFTRLASRPLPAVFKTPCFAIKEHVTEHYPQALDMSQRTAPCCWKPWSLQAGCFRTNTHLTTSILGGQKKKKKNSHSLVDLSHAHECSSLTERRPWIFRLSVAWSSMGDTINRRNLGVLVALGYVNTEA